MKSAKTQYKKQWYTKYTWYIRSIDKVTAAVNEALHQTTSTGSCIRFIRQLPKFAHVSANMHNVLHWLQRVSYPALLLLSLTASLAVFHPTCVISATQWSTSQQVGCPALWWGANFYFHELAWLLGSIKLSQPFHLEWPPIGAAFATPPWPNWVL